MSENILSDTERMTQSSSTNFPRTNELDEQISIPDLIMILLRGKLIIITCITISIISGILFAFFSPETFITRTIFFTKTNNKNIGNLGQLAAFAGLNIGSSGNADPSVYLDKVINDSKYISSLFNQEWYYKGDTLPLETILKIKPDTSLTNWKHAFLMKKILVFRKKRILSLKKDLKSGLLTLSAEAFGPILSYDLNLYTINYISSYIRKSIKSQAKEKRLFIGDRIKESKSELEKSENELAIFKSANLMSHSPQTILEETRLAREVAMNQEIYIQLQKQYELAKIEELDDQPLIQIVKSADIPIVKSKPKRKLILLFSSVIGFILGIIGVALHRMVYSYKNHFTAK